MRLTLRTILAYLDDVLEPAQAREIGEKIADSKEAAELMTRIREVIRRRRIGAPELAGPGSGPDPNLVADYLENLLAPAQVVELERLCQASDMHLAEVAACHKILSMVVGHPIDVPDEMRDRMYALGVSKTPVDQTAGDHAPAMAEGMTGVHTDSASGLPEYLTRRSFFQQYGVLSAVLLSTLFWVIFVWTDSALWSRAPVYDPVAATDSADVPAANPQAGQNGNRNLVLPPEALPAMETPVVNTVIPTVAGTISSMPMPPMPEIDPFPDDQDEFTEDEVEIEDEPVPVRERFPESPLVYLSGDEFLIKKLTTEAEWVIHSTSIPIEVDDEFASPAPFRNTFSMANAVDVTLFPGTRVSRILRTEASVLGLDLNRGQLLIQRPITTDAAASIDLLAAGQEWSIDLLEPGTTIAVELQLPQTSGNPNRVPIGTPSGGLVVTAGKIRISSAGQPEIELNAQQGFVHWPAVGTELVQHADLTVPAWTLTDDNLITPAARQLFRLFQKEFIPDRFVSQSIGPVVRDRRANISELAVRTMSMLDHYTYLIPALESAHQESRLAAIAGIRSWLAEDPEKNAPLLKQELEKVFRQEFVPIIDRLLWGFSDHDARDANQSRQLLDWMKDDQIAIRQLAYEFVSRVTGKTYDYSPMAPVTERRAAITRWEDYLRRGNGTLLPASSTPAE